MKRIAAVFAGAALLALCGCRSGSNEVSRNCFDEISAQLVPGGTYYTVSQTAPLKKELTGLRNRCRTALDAASLSEKEKDLWEYRLALAEFLLHFSGLAELEGWGASSVAATPKLYENRLYLLPGKRAEEGIWRIFAGKKHEWKSYWETLPADTSVAMGIELDRAGAAVLGRMLCRLASAMFPALPVKPEWGKIFEDLNGTWHFAAVFHDADLMQGTLWQLSLPDKDGKLLEKLELFSIAKEKTASGCELNLLPCPGYWAPVVRYADGILTIHNTPEARKYFESPARKLSEWKAFCTLAQNFPADGCGFFYQGQLPESFTRIGCDAFTLELFPQSAPELALIRRQGRGLLLEQRAETDWTQNHFRSRILLPAAAVSVFRKRILQFLLPPRRGKSSRVVHAIPVHSRECMAQLRLFYSALQQYAKKHNGAFPAGENLAGWRQLIAECGLTPAQIHCPDRQGRAESVEAMTAANCSYAYFAGWNMHSAPKLPLVLDWPMNHPDCFHVLYRDGTVAKLKLKNPRSFRRIASYLYTLHRYDEADFRKLLELAGRLDRLFHLE